MRHVFWFSPGKLAGRSGPSKDPWNLPELKNAGFGAVLSVNDGDLCHPEDFERSSLSYLCVPLSPNAPPRAGDLEHCLTALPVALDYVRSNERMGVATLVHCHSGKDRTGLFLAYYATRVWQLTAQQSIEAVRKARPIAFTAVGWEDFALDVLVASGAKPPALPANG
jgi:protein-tyrosine phosphatase